MEFVAVLQQLLPLFLHLTHLVFALAFPLTVHTSTAHTDTNTLIGAITNTAVNVALVVAALAAFVASTATCIVTVAFIHMIGALRMLALL